MFNKTINNSVTEVNPITQVIEKSISPDKVTEMYDAVKEEVLNSIIRTYTVENNSLKFGVIEYTDLLDIGALKYRTSFLLNGKEHRLEGEIPRNEMSQTQAVLIEKVVNQYAKVISMELLSQGFNTHIKMVSNR